MSTIDKSWVTLASVLDKILKHDGANGFAIPHMGKDKLLRESSSLPVAVQALEEALEKVQMYDEEEDQLEREQLAQLERLLEDWDSDDSVDSGETPDV